MYVCVALWSVLCGLTLCMQQVQQDTEESDENVQRAMAAMGVMQVRATCRQYACMHAYPHRIRVHADNLRLHAYNLPLHTQTPIATYASCPSVLAVVFIA